MTDRKTYIKQYYIDNKEKEDRRNKEWRRDNPEHRKEYMKQYYLNNQEHIKAYSEQRQKDNPEYQREYKKQERINKPERVRAIGRKHNNKRKRNLGFNPLNEYFEGSEAHHINRNDVIYIIKELHRSIKHCLETGKNMDKINKISMANIR